MRHQGSISSHSKTSGALGPDVSAFIGRIFVLDPPPEHQLDLVDIPIFTQGEDTPLGLLMQVDEEDLSEYSKQRLRAVTSSQEEISVSVLRENSHIDPLQQINAARTIRQQAAELHRFLAWNGIPDYEQLRKTCEIIFDQFIQRPSNGVFSGAQLAFRLNEMRRAGTIQDFISTILQRDNRIESADEAVEAAFLFERNWASFAFPRYLAALERIQREIFTRVGMRCGDNSFYGAQVENLFLPVEIPALEEYGIPIQVSVKLQRRLVLGEGLDRAIDSLKQLAGLENVLSDFERQLVEDARSEL